MKKELKMMKNKILKETYNMKRSNVSVEKKNSTHLCI